jgi:hypothetical protein
VSVALSHFQLFNNESPFSLVTVKSYGPLSFLSLNTALRYDAIFEIPASGIISISN